MIRSIAVILISIFAFSSCNKKNEFLAPFDNTHDRVWVGRDFWSIPLEDWKVANGALHCTGAVTGSRVHLLTHVLSPGAGSFHLSVKAGLVEEGPVPGAAGILVGVSDDEDPAARAACYFGKGIRAGVSLKGYAFLKEERVELPRDFDFSEFKMVVTGNNRRLRMHVTDKNGSGPGDLSCRVDRLEGLVAVVNNPGTGANEEPGKSRFFFDDLHLSGTKVVSKPENAFGPVLWTMYTLNRGTVKLMALLPPLGEGDNQEVALQLKTEQQWKTMATKKIDPDARTAVFKFEKGDATGKLDYRVEYIETGKDGTRNPCYYEGTIREEPLNRPLKLGGLTCQYHYGFPYSPLVANLKKLDPDMLYFSGDQIYEGNGGYPIKRSPADLSVLSYLGKYYMFGWAFGDLMRDRPTICTPDDHDVFHGNLWGEGGIAKPGGAGSSDTRGFMQSAKMVNVVNQTQCGQLPDPFDPMPIGQGMSVWYTGLTYGRISFAIVSDRIFKTGPEAVSDWEGRHDHMHQPREDLSFLDKPGVQLLGKRQMKFLNHWVRDWKGADMKVLLSQTVFANVATHHGQVNNYLYGDLDSGGWPKSGRDKVIRLMRKAAVFHINGDQHLPTLVQYGLDEYRDAGWSFCTPAIAVGYQRWFRPDERGMPVKDRPGHGYPNTGKYTDAFGNKNFVYAVGNPGKISIDRDNRYNQAQIRSSGFGFITFNKKKRIIHIDAWRFKARVDDPNPVRDQFPGWPHEISQFSNLGRHAGYSLPEISINKTDQLLKVLDEETGELVLIFRIRGTTIHPRLHEKGTYSVIVGEEASEKRIRGLKATPGENPEKLEVKL